MTHSFPTRRSSDLGGVAPGSTIKPLTALAGLDSGVRRPEERTLSTGMFRLPGMRGRGWGDSHRNGHGWTDARKSIWDSVNTYYRSEEHTSELQSLMRISYAVFCLKKKKTKK